MNVLIVDDEPGLRSGLRKILTLRGYEVFEASGSAEAKESLSRRQTDIVLLDLALGAENGVDLLRDIVEKEPMTAVVIITGNGEIKSAVECMRLGARNYLTKPIDQDLLLSVIEREIAVRDIRRENIALRSTCDEPSPLAWMESRNPRMREVERIVHKVKDTPATVLILGDTGTGKEITARRIHSAGVYRDKPFIGLNCASLNENLVESELFGHEKGSFTGAVGRKLGRFELAGDGILFLDEIGDMPQATQSKLLRVLQEREFERVGGMQSIRARCRIITATNRDLGELMKAGRFREDLFYRLSLVQIRLPSLRDRREDIPGLIDLFIAEANAVYGKAVKGADSASVEAALRYDWPGNIRELKNLVTSKVILSDADVIRWDGIPNAAEGDSGVPAAEPGLKDLLGKQQREAERKMIRETLDREKWNISGTARKLGISRKTLYEKMERYGIYR